jgi:diguanylate cyclase (GGDEF)-like protein
MGMKKFGSVERLAAGSTFLLAAAVVILAVLFPSQRLSWLIAGIVGLTAIIGFLLRQLNLQTNELQGARAELDDNREDLTGLTVELTEMSLVDPLTGARNRRGYIDLVDHQMRVAAREWKKLHFVFVDIDDMKSINEEFGHTAGDSALIEIVEIIWASSRNVDVVGRMGGDEFAVALIHADDPSIVATRIAEGVAARVRDPKHPYELHVSIGIATFDPAVPETLDEMIKEARETMYAEKHAAAEARAAKLASPSLR